MGMDWFHKRSQRHWVSSSWAGLLRTGCSEHHSFTGSQESELTQQHITHTRQLTLYFYINYFIYWFERGWEGEWGRGGRERRKHWSVVPLIYAFTSWFLYVPSLGIEPTTLVYWDNAPTNWTIQSRQHSWFEQHGSELRGPLICGFFFSFNTVNAFSLPYDFLKFLSSSLLYCKSTAHNTYHIQNMC